MINLMPPEFKRNLIYARRNLTLVKWLTAVFVAVIGVVIIVTGGYLYINQSTRAYAGEVARHKESLAKQELEQTQKRTEDISNSTKLALQVLSRQVLFSELMRQIGAVMPSGASLQSLSISKLEGGIDLQAVAVDYQTGSQVQINLADPTNKIFEKADIVNINCASATSQNEAVNKRYPCQVNIRALFSKDSSYLYTNSSAKVENSR